MDTTKGSLAFDAQLDAQEHLHWKICYQTTLSALSLEAKKLKEVERELNVFLATYYDAISDYLDELEQIESARALLLDSLMPHATHIAHKIGLEPSAASQKASGYDAWVKQLYRVAVRTHHPDLAVDEAAAHARMTRLNAAREQGDIDVLMRAAMPHMDEENEASLGMFKARCMELDAWKEALHERRRTIASSPAYELYLKAFEARLAGRNWLASVTQKLQQEISQRKRQIMQLEWQSVA